MSLISVIIPTYNAALHILAAIESVKSQTIQDFEIIVSDDGSTDDTHEVLARYRSDSRIRYLRNDNSGPSRAKNLAVFAARGEYLLFLDADDTLAPNALEVLRDRSVASGAAWSMVDVLKRLGETSVVRHMGSPPQDFVLAILDEDFITRSPFYVRQEFIDCGMYDERLWVREDWDINIRMTRTKRPFVYVPEPLYIYSRTEGSLMNSNRRRILVCTEMVLCKHHKSMADMGSKDVAMLYAKNMWRLARDYFYQLGDYSEALRCLTESLSYDMSLKRLAHPLLHQVRSVWGNSLRAEFAARPHGLKGK